MEGQRQQPQTPESLGDRELLRRFVQDSDETAFAQIVQRYERLVMSVCRRVIGSGPDADDAFQATFITLARRPRQIRKVESLSSWLYGVAWRISARLVRGRRKHPVQPLPDEQSGPAPDPLQQIEQDQEAVILDEELQSLPNKYRDVLVMTYFADQSSQQIADQLDVSKGTVDGRIRQGRNMLRVKLARRGVGIGVLTIAANLLTTQTVSASPTLLGSTIELGTQTLSQSLSGTTDISNLEPLVRPEITSMLGTKALLSAALGIAAIAGIAGMNPGGQDEAGQPGPPKGLETTQAEAVAEAQALGSPGESVVVSLGSQPIKQVSKPAASPTKPTPSSVAVRYNAYPNDARPTEKWLFETFDKPIPHLTFSKGTPLTEVLEELASHYSDEVNVMQIWPDRVALEDYSVQPLEALILSQDVNLKNVSFASAMRLLLGNLDGNEESLAVVVKNEVLVVTTQEEADSEENFTIRTYDVAALLGVEVAASMTPATSAVPKASGGGGGLFSVPSNPAYQLGGGGGQAGAGIGVDIADVVVTMTSPPAEWQSEHGAGGSIALVGTKLVVRQSQRVHREIVKLLNLLATEI